MTMDNYFPDFKVVPPKRHSGRREKENTPEKAKAQEKVNVARANLDSFMEGPSPNATDTA